MGCTASAPVSPTSPMDAKGASVLPAPVAPLSVPATLTTSTVLRDGAAPPTPGGSRGRERRVTKEHMLSKQNLKSGKDEFGARVRIFTASLCCERAHGLGLDKFTWEGDTLDSDLPGLRMPGKARHGQGTITYESGDSYEGGWKDDKRSGFGKMTFACGDFYEGEWVEGKYAGHGKYTNAEIGTYEGEWKANQKHGTGRTYYSETGDVYEGSYVAGVREGYGTYTKGNGEIRMGRYEKGELVADN